MKYSWRLLALFTGNCLALGLGILVYHQVEHPGFALATGIAVLILTTWLSYHALGYPLERYLQSLELALLNLKDGEFSLQLPKQKNSTFNQLNQLFNQVIANLRKDKTHLLERDLMLNRVFETVTSALVLTDARQKIVLCNPTARQLLNQGKPVHGLALAELRNSLPTIASTAMLQQQPVMFTLDKIDAEPERWYLFCERFQLHGHEHCLYHFQPLTQVLARAEVDTWKKVIRVFSHELNNSLAPVNSLAHSGLQLTLQSSLDADKKALLEKIFVTLQDRATHLQAFLSEYAQFARLPTPVREPVNWLAFLTGLQGLCSFQCLNTHINRAGFFDSAQMAQVIINLVKNAQEAGATNNGISLSVKPQGQWDLLVISDDGCGMSEEQLKQATLPFYSTKRDGTGLGLALCREIIEAHNGRISFSNNPDKGLSVAILLPGTTASEPIPKTTNPA